jgi:hypothetical protein
MRIKYDTRLTSYHTITAFSLGWLLFFIICFNAHLQYLLGESEKSILQSRNITITQRPTIFYCELPYDDCLCSVISNQTNTSDKCVSFAVLVGSRVLSLISFLFQIALVREILSISTDRPSAVIYTLWIISLFAFIGMIISIHWDSCYHAYITVILSVTGTLLSFLGLWNALIVRAFFVASVNSNKIVVVQKSEKDNKEGQSWQELI